MAEGPTVTGGSTPPVALRHPSQEGIPHCCAAALIVFAAVAAYHNSFSGALVLDDSSSILGNPTIRHLWPLSGPLSPPHGDGLTVEGRPVLNLSLALNYAISGTKVWSYHAVNLAIHILAGLTLFGIVRRTIDSSTGFQPVSSNAHGLKAHATFLALSIALLWTLHPLQTESVTYLIQRAESLMGLFYLLTLYCFIRYTTWRDDLRVVRFDVDAAARRVSPSNAASRRVHAGFWFAAAFATCLLGMATKEVMVSAPIVVLLYDRTFPSGTFRKSFRRHGFLHLALASTWILLVFLVFSAGNRGGTSAFGSGVSWWTYLQTQPTAILRYLRLSIVPYPLVFDYGTEWKGNAWGVILAVLLVGASFATLRRFRFPLSAFSFLCLSFLLLLAPTSLIPGNRQTMAEHRMYLPLVAVIIAAVLGLSALPGKRSFYIFPVLAIALGWTTYARNRDYRSELALYTDTVAKRPLNPFAQCNLGTAYFAQGDATDALPHLEEAVRLRPAYPVAQDDLGNVLLAKGRVTDAVGHYQEAIRLKPDFADAHNNLASAYIRLGRTDDAVAEFQEALRLAPDDAEAHNNLGNIYAMKGRGPESITQYGEALQLDPNYAAAQYNLANALVKAGQLDAAKIHYRQALRLRPDFPEARRRLDQLQKQ